jgi:putative oxidoreductase
VPAVRAGQWPVLARNDPLDIFGRQRLHSLCSLFRVSLGYFASLGLPAIVAYGTIALELLGGIALILGIYVSWVALPLAIEVLGTIVLVHGANGWLFTNKGGGWEYPAFWTVGLIVLYLLGDGALALRPGQRDGP